MNRSWRRRSLIGPLLLIGIGVLFLMNNLGALNWSVWELIFRLWPIFLIAAGLDLVIGRRSVWGSLLAVVLIVGVVAIGVTYAQTDTLSGSRSREDLSFPAHDVRRAEIHLSPAVGVIYLTGSDATSELLSGTAWIGAGMRVVKEFSEQGEGAVLNLRTEGAGVVFPTLGPPGRPTWDLRVSSALPIDLSLEMGVGQSVVDLRGTRVDNLRLSQGVGQQVVYFPRNGVMRANLSTGVGETVVVIPPGVAANIHVSTVIAARSIPADFVKSGDNYASPDYAGASDRVDLQIEVAIGNLVVRVGTE